jgi:hypothetical protein
LVPIGAAGAGAMAAIAIGAGAAAGAVGVLVLALAPVIEAVQAVTQQQDKASRRWRPARAARCSSRPRRTP